MADKGGRQGGAGHVVVAVLAAVLVVVTAATVWLSLSLADVRSDARGADQAAERRIAALVTRAAVLEATVRDQSVQLGSLEAKATGQRDPVEVAAAARPGVVTVSSAEGGPLGGLGSGFVYSSGEGALTIIVTAANLVVKQWRVKIQAVTIIQGDQSYAGIVQEVNEKDNLAVITVTTTLPSLPVADAPPKVGDRLLVLGDPFGPEQTTSLGAVSAVRTVDGLDAVQVSTPIGDGDSGAAVLTRDGRVVGVAMAPSVSPRGMQVVPISRVCEDFAFC